MSVNRYLFIFILILTQIPGYGQGQILEKIITRVGSEQIFYSELQELFSYAKQQNPEYTDDLKCEILDQLISSKILLDQAKLDSIFIDDAELTQSIDRRMNQILGQMGGDEEVFKEYYGVTVAEQREQMRGPMREQMIQQRIQQRIIQNVEITPKEVVEFFNRIPSDSLPYLPAEVELAEISIKTRISDEVRDAAKAKLERVRSRIVDDGESFAELASLFSDDPGSALNGGDLGWAKRGSYVPEFEAAAFALEPGEISEVIETQFGYHILELIERRGNSINLRHILIRPETRQDDIDATKAYLDSIRQLIIGDNLSFQVAVRRYGDDETQSYNNAGRMLNNNTGDTFFEMGPDHISHHIYFAIESLKEGEISQVVELEENGEKRFKLIQLLTRTRPHVASLESDLTRIENFAKESKKNEYFNDWMTKKLKNTEIYIVPEFRNCSTLVKYTDL